MTCHTFRYSPTGRNLAEGRNVDPHTSDTSDARVTVVISHYNSSRTLPDTIRSVLAQTLTDWRMIILDDGSTEELPQELREIDDPRITFIHEPTNMGTPVRLNQLTRLCKTEYIARMDADDMMHPCRLEVSLAALEENPELDLVVGEGVVIDELSQPVGMRRTKAEPDLIDHFKHSPFIHSTLTARRAWLLANPYDEFLRRCQDQELFIATYGRRQMAILPMPLLYMREAHSVTAAKYASSMRGERAITRKHKALLRPAQRLLLDSMSWGKQLTYLLFDRLGQIDKLIERRSDSLHPSLARQHGDVIDNMLALPLK